MNALSATRAACALLFSTVVVSASAAEPLPKVEAGIGAAMLALPTYRGSDHYGVVGLPVPYLVYRGDRLRVTRQGVRARLFDSAHFEVGISGAFTVPGHHGDDPAREGMPALRSTLEIGPSFDWNWVGPESSLCICVPVRSVTATNLRHWNPAGWLAHPQLRLQQYRHDEAGAVILSESIGPVFADRKYHAYFYQVLPQYATADRPAYSARAGYSGLRASLFLGLRHGHWSGGAGVIADWLGGASFDDSPLVKSRQSYTVGLGLAYRLWSQGRAYEEDEPAE